MGSAIGFRGQADEGKVLLDEGIAIFRATNNTLQLGWALVWRGVLAQFIGDLDGAVAFASEAHSLLAARNEQAFSAFARADIAAVAVYRGDYSTAEATLGEALSVARVCVSPAVESHVLALQSLLALARGDMPLAFAIASESFEILEKAGSLALAGFAIAVSGLAAVRLGDVAGARTLLEKGLALPLQSPPATARMRWARADLSRRTGASTAAVNDVHEALRLCLDLNELLGGADSLELLADLISEDEPATAVRLLGAAERIRREIGFVRFACFSDEYDGVVRRLHEALGADYQPLFDEGAGLSFADAVAYAGRGRGPRPRPPVGWESLTPMERDVAALIAKGMSNPDIAAQLFISRNTVKAHLAHAYAKLGVANRSELASEVSRRELTQGAAQA
jgi:ATP/maltotriose-dependent transcriptional regulator MalT